MVFEKLYHDLFSCEFVAKSFSILPVPYAGSGSLLYILIDLSFEVSLASQEHTNNKKGLAKADYFNRTCDYSLYSSQCQPANL